MTKQEFLEKCSRSQPGAWLGLPLERVVAVAERQEDLAGSTCRPQYFLRKYYMLSDGTVLARLTSKGFRRVDAPDAEILALLEQGKLAT